MPYISRPLHIPFRMEYGMKLVEQYPGKDGASMAHIKNIPYGKVLIDNLLALKVVAKDIPRIPFKLDPTKDQKFYHIIDNNEAAFYQEIITDAAKAGITLNVNEIQAFYAFHNSLGGKFEQGGVFRGAERMIKNFMDALGIKVIDNEDTKREDYVQIKKEGDLLQVATSYQTAEYVDTSPNEPAPYVANPAMHVLNTYLLAEDEEGSFTLSAPDDAQLCLIDAVFWMERILPAGLELLKKPDLTNKDFFDLMPLLTEISFRAPFFAKLIQQPIRMQLAIFEYIDIYCGPDVELNKSIREDYIKTCKTHKKTVSALAESQCSLEALVTQKMVPESQVEAVITLIESVNALSPSMKANNHGLLSTIFIRTAQAIRNPLDAENMEQYQKLIRATENARLIKVAATITIIVCSVVLMALSIVAAVASFGASSLLTGLAVFIGVNAISQSLTILSAVTATGVAAYAATMLTDRDFPQVRNAAKNFSSFWSAPKEKTVEVVVAQTMQVEPPRPA